MENRPAALSVPKRLGEAQPTFIVRLPVVVGSCCSAHAPTIVHVHNDVIVPHGVMVMVCDGVQSSLGMPLNIKKALQANMPDLNNNKASTKVFSLSVM